MKAYDLNLKLGEDYRVEGSSGWAFGLPPGITPQQWPLDPHSGYPLKHGFTLLLPLEYRVHGPEIIALSFFAISPEHNDGGPEFTPGLFDLIKTPGETPPDDAALRRFWVHARTAHPCMHRMTDNLNCEYAVVLLTAAEFSGPLCSPPEIASSPRLKQDLRPDWIQDGSAYYFYKTDWTPSPFDKFMPPSYRENLLKTKDIVPPRIDFGVPIFIQERIGDPNAGKKAPAGWAKINEAGDYELPFDDSDAYWKPWAKELYARNHIGGTMFPSQGHPDFSPYYIEFEESFGDYNFGTGNAQLDILNLKFDWSC